MKNKHNFIFGFTIMLSIVIITMIRCEMYEIPKFPSGFHGIWQKDFPATYADELTFTPSTIRASNQTNYWKLITISGDSYTMEHSSNSYEEITVVIKLINGNLEISGNSGTNRDDWSGSWKRKGIAP